MPLLLAQRVRGRVESGKISENSMWWQYFLVFICSFAVDVFPIPLPPAWTVMVLLQIIFRLDIWWVIVIGVSGSILGRYVLTLYVSRVSDHLFRQDKHDDVNYLGQKMKENKWKGQALVLAYSLMPLPTTPLFLAAGMARLGAFYIIPAFTIGKFISDAATVLVGRYATENAEELLSGIISWRSITGLLLGLALIFALLFIDWRTLLKAKKLKFSFDIWKSRGEKTQK